MKRKRHCFHPSSFRLHPWIWPDSGLTRNTRARGYRCSVPGLAGFTGAALCGARSLITCQGISHCDCQLPIGLRHENARNDFDLIIRQWQIGNPHLAIGMLNRRLAVRQHSQQAIDGEMQQDVGDYRNNDWQQ
jgi:hypothetical protein